MHPGTLSPGVRDGSRTDGHLLGQTAQQEVGYLGNFSLQQHGSKKSAKTADIRFDQNDHLLSTVEMQNYSPAPTDTGWEAG